MRQLLVDVPAGEVVAWSEPRRGTGINCVFDDQVYDVAFTGGAMTPYPVGEPAVADGLVANTYRILRLEGDDWVDVPGSDRAEERPRNEIPRCTPGGYVFASPEYRADSEILAWSPGGGWETMPAGHDEAFATFVEFPGAAPVAVEEGAVYSLVAPGRWEAVTEADPWLSEATGPSVVLSSTTAAVCDRVDRTITSCRTLPRTDR